MLPSTLVFVIGASVIERLAYVQSFLARMGCDIGNVAPASEARHKVDAADLLCLINRVGRPFLTAFIMNLEPLVTTILSMLLLGELLTPVQAFGAAVMLVSLCVFQFVRAR